MTFIEVRTNDDFTFTISTSNPTKVFNILEDSKTVLEYKACVSVGGGHYLKRDYSQFSKLVDSFNWRIKRARVIKRPKK